MVDVDITSGLPGIIVKEILGKRIISSTQRWVTGAGLSQVLVISPVICIAPIAGLDDSIRAVISIHGPIGHFAKDNKMARGRGERKAVCG